MSSILIDGPMVKGNTAHIVVKWTDDLGTPYDPVTGTRFILRPPDRILRTYDLGTTPVSAKLSPGTYAVDAPIDQSGSWFVRAECIGGTAGAVEGSFLVDESEVV